MGRFHSAPNDFRRLPHSVIAHLLVSTRGTSTWISIRSSSGLKMRFRYFVTVHGAQEHGLIGSHNTRMGRRVVSCYGKSGRKGDN